MGTPKAGRRVSVRALKPGTREHRRANDSRLRKGRVVVVDDDPPVLETTARLIRRFLNLEVATSASLEALDPLLRPPGKLTARRIRVRGFVIDWFLGRQNALDVLAWLDRVYPRTPVLLYTGLDDVDAIAKACAARKLGFRLVAQHGAAPHPLPEAVRDATLGFVMSGGRPLVLVRKLGCTNREVLAFFDEQLFAPWDERCIEIREYLLERVCDGRHLPERLLCVLDCAFDGIPHDSLPHARDVTKLTSSSDLSEIYAAFGGIPGLEFLTSPWLFSRVGRGPAYAAPDPWSALVAGLSNSES